jgi:glutamate/tyrosine decarboxylase-like PLP-dependent enzyme
MLRKLKAKNPFVEDGVLLSKLVMYTSKLAHSCVEKAGMIAMVKIRHLDPDENYSLRGSTVEKVIKDDRSNGLIPFFVSCTFGTTCCCSFDNLQEIGMVCKKEDIYLHVDGAYAGSALICEEFRQYANGLEVNYKYLNYAPSYSINSESILF